MVPKDLLLQKLLTAWSAHQRMHITDTDVGILAEKGCHIDSRDKIMTAMCTAMDTVWIGLANGHIMVFRMNPPGELLTFSDLITVLYVFFLPVNILSLVKRKSA